MSFFSPHYEAPFAPPFEQEPFDKKVNFFPSISDDPFSNVRQDFARIFHENNLDAFANPGDFGLPEKTEMGLDAFNGPASRPRGPSFNLNPLAFPPRDMNMGNPYNTINYGNGNINKFTGRFQEEQYQQYEPINNMIKRDLSPIRDYPDTFVDDPLSHMWSSDPAGELKNVMNQPNPPQFYTSMDILNGALGFQTYNRNPSFPYVNSHMANLLAQAQVIEKPPVAMPKEEPKLAKNKKSAYKEKSSTDASVKLEKSSNQSLHHMKDVSGKLSDDEDGLEDFCGEKGRSLKGLRVLSQRVKQIVIEKQKTTYKEVAEMLIKEVVTLSKTKTASESKDEQNVKRRVYDALNVLIATGILKKEGKTVVCNEIYQSAAPAIPLKVKGEKERNRPFSHKIAEAQNRKKEKVDALNELLYKTLALKNLIKMNKEKAGHQLLTKNGPNSFGTQRLNAQGAQHAVPSNSQETIKFPFLVIESTTPENSMNLNLDQSQKELLVESTHELKIYGDVDILLKMKLHNVSRGFFEEQIPNALQKYVPSTFLDSLA